MNPPDIVSLGNLLIDDVVLPDGSTRMGQAGGATLYLTLAARLWGATVGVASVRGADFPADACAELERRGVDLSGVRRVDGPSLRTWLLYEGRRRRVIHHLGMPSHAERSPEPSDLPEHFLRAKVFHLAPMPFDVQRRLVEFLASETRALISVDPHEPVTETSLDAWRALLRHADAFFVSEDEMRLDGADADPHRALRRVAGETPSERPRFIAYKRGVNGGLLYDATRPDVIEWQPIPRPTGEPTGAGDAFAGGFLAAWARGGTTEQALEQAIVSASFALDDFGTQGLRRATVEQAGHRRRYVRDHMKAPNP